MRETLKLLVELQDLEDALRDLRALQENLEKVSVENAESRVVFEEMLKARESDIRETEAFCKAKQAEISEAEENARRARTRMTSITSQRELTALNKELDIARRKNQSNSEELKKLSEQLGAAQADYEKKKSELAELSGQMTQIENDIRQDISEREADASLQRNRQLEIRKVIDKRALSTFSRISKGRNGIGVASVTNEICSACRMAVPPQVYIRVLQMESIEQCHNCLRIIVYREGLEQNPPAADAPEEVIPSAS